MPLEQPPCLTVHRNHERRNADHMQEPVMTDQQLTADATALPIRAHADEVEFLMRHMPWTARIREVIKQAPAADRAHRPARGTPDFLRPWGRSSRCTPGTERPKGGAHDYPVLLDHPDDARRDAIHDQRADESECRRQAASQLGIEPARRRADGERGGQDLRDGVRVPWERVTDYQSRCGRGHHESPS
jgi:hypothetical protein